MLTVLLSVLRVTCVSCMLFVALGFLFVLCCVVFVVCCVVFVFVVC